MAGGSKIEWTEATWNPVTGCSKISEGCRFCYAERMAFRLQAMGKPQYQNGFQPTMQPAALDAPRSWRKPRVVFVNSMSDLFHEKVDTSFIAKVFGVMNECDQHTFQVLTKRPDRALAISDKLTWTSNIWLGVSVENQEMTGRIKLLQQIPAALRFLSVEPLIGRISRLPLQGIGWVIVGGESGPGARPMNPDWVREIRNKCQKANVPFFFKQWGGTNKKKAGRILDDRTWDDLPHGLRTVR